MKLLLCLILEKPFLNGINKKQGLKLLSKDLATAVNKVNTAVTVDLTQNQFDALVAFTYNVGAQGFATSTLLHLINICDLEKLESKVQIKSAFMMWIKVKGKVSKGLITRREGEAKLFFDEWVYMKLIYFIKLIACILLIMPLAVIAQLNCNSDKLADLEACANQQLELARAQLSEAYKKAMVVAKQFDAMEPKQSSMQAKLIDTQNKWEKYAEANCDNAFALYDGGAEAGIQKLGCLEEMTKQRIEQLTVLYLER